MADRTIIVPIVHDNGTSAEELLTLREEVYATLDEAVKKLRKMAPNGRDYYLDPERLPLAEAQHRRRVATLRELMDDLESECRIISAAQAGKKRTP